MTTAILDEYLALATYEKIVATYAITTPFTNLINGETNHIEALKNLMASYNFTIPANTVTANLTIPATLVACFEQSIVQEENNIAMYGEFLNEQLPEDIKLVFTNLQNASTSHLEVLKMKLDQYQFKHPTLNSGSKTRPLESLFFLLAQPL